MKLLLDTCTFIWFYSDPVQLSARAGALLQDATNELWLSVASVWEIVVKNRKGKLSLHGADIELIVNQQVRVNNVRLLPIEYRHVLEGRMLPLHHTDPFDRLLICQAMADRLTVVTPDAAFRNYALPVEW